MAIKLVTIFQTRQQIKIGINTNPIVTSLSMKNIYLLLFLFIVSCNDGEEVLGECYVSPKPDVICSAVYEPVCACNNLVYSNSCLANKAGNLKWKSTKLSTGESCNY